MGKNAPFCILFSLLLLLPLSATDWPQFRGPNRNGTITGIRLSTKWPDRLDTRWKKSLGAGYSSPAVVGEKLFVISQENSEETVWCLDAGNGKTIWQHSYRARFTSQWGDGPRTTPAVDNGQVYTIGGTGEMYCLDTSSGKVLWMVSFADNFKYRTPQFGYSSSPLIDGPLVIVHPGGTGGDSVVAMDKITGNIVWQSRNERTGYASPFIIPASAGTGKRQLIVFSETQVASLNPESGQSYWQYPWQTQHDQNVAQPMFYANTLYSTSLTGFGAFQLSQRGAKPKVEKLWLNSDMIIHFSNPVIHKGHLYGFLGRRARLTCVELKQGTVEWQKNIPAQQRGGIILVDSTLLVFTDMGQLWVVEASPSKFREYAHYKISGKSWVPPVLAGNNLYLRDRDSLYCIDLVSVINPPG